MRQSVSRAVAVVLGSPPSQWTSRRHRGYSHNDRWLVRLSDGRTAFVKAAVDWRTAAWLRAEYRVYSSVRAPVLPRFLGWADNDDLPVLVLEDLSSAYWPPPWTRAHIDAVVRLLGDVARTEPPADLPRLGEMGGLQRGWPDVAAEPGPFLRLGLCSQAWLERHLAVFQQAAAAAPLDGDALLHLDVRSDNICIRDGQALLIDWNWAVVGNPLMDLVGWLPSLHAEGGPPPEELAGDRASGLAALVAGYFAAQAGLPPIPHAPRVREVQLSQLRVALPWAARALGLPPP